VNELQRPIRPGAGSFRRMSPGAIALALLLKYGILVIYSIHATIITIPSFVEVGGRVFSLVWSLIVGVLSLLAFIGVLRTWYTNRVRLEKWTTALLALGLIVYSVVLIVRGVLLGNWSGTSLGWIPLALCAFPIIRYYFLVWDES
jgi:hypothetical protein